MAFSDELYDEAQDGIAMRAVLIQISRLFCAQKLGVSCSDALEKVAPLAVCHSDPTEMRG